MSKFPVLIASQTSPFGRLARIARLELGLADQVMLSLLDPQEAKVVAARISPLAKSPILNGVKGSFLADSRTIIAYFHSLSAPRSLWRQCDDKFEGETRLALALGMLEAGQLLLYERVFREEPMRSDAWQAHQWDKIDRTALALMQEVLASRRQGVDLGDIAFVVALDYVAFRFDRQIEPVNHALKSWRKVTSDSFPTLAETHPLQRPQ